MKSHMSQLMDVNQKGNKIKNIKLLFQQISLISLVKILFLLCVILIYSGIIYMLFLLYFYH